MGEAVERVVGNETVAISSEGLEVAEELVVRSRAV